jgi:hypothetical protein
MSCLALTLLSFSLSDMLLLTSNHDKRALEDSWIRIKEDLRQFKVNSLHLGVLWKNRTVRFAKLEHLVFTEKTYVQIVV